MACYIYYKKLQKHSDIVPSTMRASTVVHSTYFNAKIKFDILKICYQLKEAINVNVLGIMCNNLFPVMISCDTNGY